MSIKILFWNWAWRCMNWFTWIFEKFNLLSESELRKARSSFENWITVSLLMKGPSGSSYGLIPVRSFEPGNIYTLSWIERSGTWVQTFWTRFGLSERVKLSARYWYSRPLIPRWWSWHNSHLPQLRLWRGKLLHALDLYHALLFQLSQE